MANRLAGETSPYLLQHANNPVSWFPWGEEAFAVAKAQDKPILLSVGYAACHWCHVMAHESFEDPVTAAMMNESFVNVKVDREERPDVDSIYMKAVVAMTGQGGWPMTVMLTPDGEPFFGGTYFPPAPRYGMPGFRQVLQSVADAWKNRRQEIIDNAGRIAVHLNSAANAGAEAAIQPGLLDIATMTIGRQFDDRWGGFGGAPKFPQAMTIEFLLRQYVRSGESSVLHMAERTLEMMAWGGMYDQLAGGFARYSTDDKWLVPHFEKMLYDNALLSLAYLHAWRISGRPLYRRVVEETLDWALTEMRHDGGGFYSSLDADSEGVEGKYYVWQKDEITQILGEDEPLFCQVFGVTAQGNWEGQNILHLAADSTQVANEFGLDAAEARTRIGQARQTLLAARSRRTRPGLDDKVLTAWNGLMLRALAEAGRYLGRRDYLDAATRTAAFLYKEMRNGNGRLFRSWKEGHGARLSAYLEDYAFLAEGLLALYQGTFDVRWYEWADELGQIILRHFRDEENHGFYDTAGDHERLILRPKEIQDNAIPSGGASAANALLLLGMFSGDGTLWDVAAEAIGTVGDFMARYPTGFAHWLCAADVLLGQPLEVAIAGELHADDTQRLVAVVRERYRPNVVVAAGTGDTGIPLLADRAAVSGKATAFVCRRFVCKLPVTEPADLRSLLP